MTDPLKMAQDALALAEKATPGPWVSPDLGDGEIPILGLWPTIVEYLKDPADTRFVCDARTRVPELATALIQKCEECERLRRLIAKGLECDVCNGVGWWEGDVRYVDGAPCGNCRGIGYLPLRIGDDGLEPIINIIDDALEEGE